MKRDHNETAIPRTHVSANINPGERLARACLALFASLSLSLAAGAQTASSTPDQSSEQNEKPIVLNPYDVNASTNYGYGAATTSSTSRVVQNYIDVPQTVNVVTSEFINDYNLQDARAALEYTTNIQWGLMDNPYSFRIRGAIVSTTYIDGVASGGQYTEMPLQFFDRIEIVKGPSSAAFGLGQPGGLMNYVAKTPQGIDSTTLRFAVGDNDNYLADFDTQGVYAANPKLKYRIVGFWDDGGYMQTNWHHNGAGAQAALRYDFNDTTRADLIVAYSSTNFPGRDGLDGIWTNHTIYEAWQSASEGGAHTYLPGTVFSNGAVFGKSPLSDLPPVGATGASSLGLLGTGVLANTNGDPFPAGWSEDLNQFFRAELILSKDLWNNHVHIRDAFVSEHGQLTYYDEIPDSIDSGYDLPAIYGVYAPGTGNLTPLLGIARSYSYQATNNWQDELDIQANFHFLGGEWTTLIGGDGYENKGEGNSYQVPDVGPNGQLLEVNLYNDHNPTLYVSPNVQITGNESSIGFGDGFYAQEDVSYFNGMIDALAGWRLDYFETTDRNYVGAYSSSSTGWVNTKGAPRFAITFKPLKWLSVYEMYTKHADPAQSTNKYFLSQGTEETAQERQEFPLNELEFFQPGGYTIEEGIKASFLGGRIYASLCWYHMITTGQLNPIVAPGGEFTNPDGTTTQIGIQQIQGLNSHGVEAEVFGQLTKRLTFTANYGIERGNFPAFANGQPDWLAPSATANLFGKYDFSNNHGNGFYVTAGGEWFGPYWIWQNAPEYVYYGSSQYLFNGGIGYKWRSPSGKIKQSIYLNCNNIFDSVVSIGIVTPWTIEALRSTFLTYSLTF